MTQPPAITTLGALRASGHVQKHLKSEMRDNLLTALREGRDPWPGLHGFEDTVIPQLERAIIAGHDVVLYALDVPFEERWARIERRNAAAGVVVISREQLEDYERWWQRPDDAEIAGYDAGGVTGGPAAG